MRRTIDIEPEPEEVADHFAEWGSDRQALFLNTAAEHFYGWSGSLGAESQALRIAAGLSDKAKDMVRAIAHFIEDPRT